MLAAECEMIMSWEVLTLRQSRHHMFNSFTGCHGMAWPEDAMLGDQPGLRSIS